MDWLAQRVKLNWEVLNYCLIVAKYNVFATSVRNGVLDFDSFLLRLNNKIDILRTIAFRSNRLSQLKKKHGPNFFTYVNASVISIILIPSSYSLLLYCFSY